MIVNIDLNEAISNKLEKSISTHVEESEKKIFLLHRRKNNVGLNETEAENLDKIEKHLIDILSNDALYEAVYLIDYCNDGASLHSDMNLLCNILKKCSNIVSENTSADIVLIDHHADSKEKKEISPEDLIVRSLFDVSVQNDMIARAGKIMESIPTDIYDFNKPMTDHAMEDIIRNVKEQLEVNMSVMN